MKMKPSMSEDTSIKISSLKGRIDIELCDNLRTKHPEIFYCLSADFIVLVIHKNRFKKVEDNLQKYYQLS